jgi:putative tricarboxylic transport membrane protein
MGRDGYAGIAILATSLALFAGTASIEGNALVPVSPAFYPRIMLGVTAVLAAALVAIDVVAHRMGRALPAKGGWRSANYSLVILEFAIFTAYTAALPYIGFRIATFVFLVVMQASLDHPRDARRWATVVAVALGTTAVVYAVFDMYLHVLLPRGVWVEL